MLTLDAYITQRFANDTLKKIYVTQEEFDTLNAWVKGNTSDYAKHYGRYEQHMGRFPKGERNFYIASDYICVEYYRCNFQERDFYKNIGNAFYLLNYQILVKQ